MFDTKIALVVREDLATWQKLNVTAFLTSGIVGANEGLLGALPVCLQRRPWRTMGKPAKVGANRFEVAIGGH